MLKKYGGIHTELKMGKLVNEVQDMRKENKIMRKENKELRRENKEMRMKTKELNRRMGEQDEKNGKVGTDGAKPEGSDRRIEGLGCFFKKSFC